MGNVLILFLGTKSRNANNEIETISSVASDSPLDNDLFNDSNYGEEEDQEYSLVIKAFDFISKHWNKVPSYWHI